MPLANAASMPPTLFLAEQHHYCSTPLFPAQHYCSQIDDATTATHTAMAADTAAATDNSIATDTVIIGQNQGYSLKS